MARKGVEAVSVGQVLLGALVCLAVFARPVWAAGEPGSAAVKLHESHRPGTATRVQTELKAKGLYRPGLPPGNSSGDTTMPKPLSMEIETRFVFIERLVAKNRHLPAAGDRRDAVTQVTERAPALRAVRHVIQAASAINGEVRHTAALIRPEVRLLTAERRDQDGSIVVASPAGPLTSHELELVQGLGDPLTLGELLPAADVRVKDRWRVPDSAAKALSEYDSLKSNKLEAWLDSIDDAKARIRIRGQIEGSAWGGPGTMTCEGFLTFDRQSALIDHLDLNRTESRQAGPVEAGLDLKSTLTLTHHPTELPRTLSDAALAKLDLDVTPAHELLRLNLPGGNAALLHDRDWHIFWEDARSIVLKRLRGGQVIAQCNLMAGPEAGKGRHQDPDQFREDIRRGLKQRFVQFLGAGEIDGKPAGGFRYKVGVQGREGQLGIIWYYYLAASPEGHQLLATFTLAEDHVKVFGNQDVEMIGSLEWLKRARAESRD